jgi:hypothetical protein
LRQASQKDKTTMKATIPHNHGARMAWTFVPARENAADTRRSSMEDTNAATADVIAIVNSPRMQKMIPAVMQ